MTKRDAPALRNVGILDMMSHPGLLGRWYSGASWNPWRAVIKAIYGLPVSDDDVAFIRQVANRAPPKKRVREAWFVVSRRGGKDSTVAGIATHAAVSFDPSGILRPGERGVVACIACDREQAKIVWRYVASYFDQIPPFKRMVTRLAESDGIIELSNSVDILVMTGSHRALRGRPILLAVLDEVARPRRNFIKHRTGRGAVPRLAAGFEHNPASYDHRHFQPVQAQRVAVRALAQALRTRLRRCLCDPGGVAHHEPGSGHARP